MPKRPNRIAASDLRERLIAWESGRARAMAHYHQLKESPSRRCAAHRSSSPECTCSCRSPLVAALRRGEPVEVDALAIWNSYRGDETACPLFGARDRRQRPIPLDAILIVHPDGSLSDTGRTDSQWRSKQRR